jgi:hypothetical protein
MKLIDFSAECTASEDFSLDAELKVDGKAIKKIVITKDDDGNTTIDVKTK